jgi:predicted MFS family arabinose efflux permease
MNSGSLAPLRTRFIVFTFTRTVLNTGFRLIYPFIATFARALGVEVEAIALAVTARSALGLSGPLLGNLGDSIGRKRAMLFGLSLFALGFTLVLVLPSYPSLLIALLLGAAGKIIFDPAMQAHLGDQVAYDRRSTAIALTEIGWSGASLLGLPIVGWFIAEQGWVSPFPLLALMMLICIFLLWRVLPDDAPTPGSRITLRSAWISIINHPPAIAALATSLLISAGNELVNIVYGLWLEESFGLQVVALGAASSVIGFAELSGEGLVATITDQLGKKRAVSIGLLITAAACIILPIIGHSIAGVLFGLFLFYLSFEFTFVSLIPLVTELVPSARATLMAGNLAAAAGGRALGAVSGSWLIDFGIWTNATFGASLTLIAGFVLWRWVKVE